MFLACTEQTQPVILIQYPGSVLSQAQTSFGCRKPKPCRSAVRHRNSFGHRRSKRKTKLAVNTHIYTRHKPVSCRKNYSEAYDQTQTYVNALSQVSEKAPRTAIFLSRPEPFKRWLASAFLTNSSNVAASRIQIGNLWIASPLL